MNAISRLFHKKWFWITAAISSLLLAGCATLVIEVVTIVVTAYNCANGNSCTQLVAAIAVAKGFGGAGNMIVAFRTALDPPAADLGNFDASLASAVLQPTNMQVVSYGGTATVTLTDENSGTTLGSSTFPFVINNNVATLSQPDAVNNWMHSYSTYQGNVKIGLGFNVGTTSPPAGTSGSLIITAEYMGSPYASSKLYTLGINPPKCPPPATNCQTQ